MKGKTLYFLLLMVILLVNMVDCQKKKKKNGGGKKKQGKNLKKLNLGTMISHKPPTVCYMNYTEGEENKEFKRECPTDFICNSPPGMAKGFKSIHACGYTIHETKMCMPNPSFPCGEPEDPMRCPPTHECDENNECMPLTSCNAEMHSNIMGEFKSIRNRLRKTVKSADGADMQNGPPHGGPGGFGPPHGGPGGFGPLSGPPPPGRGPPPHMMDGDDILHGPLWGPPKPKFESNGNTSID